MLKYDFPRNLSGWSAKYIRKNEYILRVLAFIKVQMDLHGVYKKYLLNINLLSEFSILQLYETGEIYLSMIINDNTNQRN